MAAVQEFLSPSEILKQLDGRRRVVIEGVQPEIDGGQFPIKRVPGETVAVEADIFADGHGAPYCRILYRWDQDDAWTLVPMHALGNDRWRGEFQISSIGRYRYTIEAWLDEPGNWRSDLWKRIAAGQDVRVDLLIGAQIIEKAAGRARGEDASTLRQWARALQQERDTERRKEIALHEDLLGIAQRYPDPQLIVRYEKELIVWSDRERARFSSWYELFPRSWSRDPGRHGTFRDCEAWLPYVASMGFDVLYMPPIHPIGRSFRKGKNGVATPEPDDTGSPWAIGASEGGHRSIHPELGTLADFRRLVAHAHDLGLEIALDLAFQTTPEHPYIREHPAWFQKRPDGTIQYAENPPKKYQDIYPLDFQTPQWLDLWHELKSVVRFWIDQGVRIFRVDNPHTKPFLFWQWLIGDIQERNPEVLFLAEAFTRPKPMYRLAKLGFSQSYTYFAWRNTKHELTEYFRELNETSVREYFRPNLWPNTPDILTAFLQEGGRPAFMIRLILAATLGASYGIYGPAFELCENIPREPGSEEYLNSEKYELKYRDLNAPQSLKGLIAHINHIRHDNAALQSDHTLQFHETDNLSLICYSKTTVDRSNIILTVVNLDPFHSQSGWVSLDLSSLGIDPAGTFQAEDLLGGATYFWQGSRNFVELTPETRPAHILRLRSGRA